MPGIIGIVSTKDAEDNNEKLLTRMCNAIKHKEWYKTDIHTGISAGLARVHLGIFNPESQPIFNEDKSLCIIMDGEIYDYEDLKKELIHKGYSFPIANDPEFILHLYEEYGNDLVHRINGSFTLAIWNEKLKKLIIINDRYGIRPLYYSENNRRLLFGSEVKAILQDETFVRIVDDRSVAEFFSFGYILGNKTFFQGIELLPPASIMTYESGRISIEQYWDFDFKEGSEEYSEEYYIEKLSKLVLQAVERQMKGHHRTGVPLTGGLDSRTLVASIQKEHYPIHTFTFGKSDCNDVKFARMISNTLGVDNHFYEFKPDDLVTYAQKAVYLTDGMQNCIHAHRMQTYDEIRDFMDVALLGWVGDSSIGSGFLRDGVSKLEDKIEIFKIITNYLSIDLLRNLFDENYFKIFQKNFNLSMNYILKIDEKVNIKLSNNRLMYYNFKERQRRFISMGPVLVRSSVEARTPFYDYDFMDFILKIPPEFKHGKHLYKNMILKMFPQLVKCPYQATGLPLDASEFHRKIRFSLQLMKGMINEMTQNVFNIKLISTTREFYDYDDWIRNNKELREYISNILFDERTTGRSYFNKDYVKEIFDMHISGKKNYSELIGRLLTFELWNRQFIDIK
ncbi:MAG: asparagine synthase-related protein [Candidatus Methanoperedens sp.]|nr:asparagine synthase-related protein [Candidatus Methanoperedens sp.]